MDFEERKKLAIESARQNIDFFSNSHKQERELYCVKKLLKIIEVDYDVAELIHPNPDPPDIIFRDMRFEITEKLDEDRKRGDEYNRKLKQAENATCDSDLHAYYCCNQFARSVQYIIDEIVTPSVLKKTSKLKNNLHYPPDKLDFVVYVNLRQNYLSSNVNESYVIGNDSPLTLWRSVSFVFNARENNEGGGVVWASGSAPAILKNACGKIARYLP